MEEPIPPPPNRKFIINFFYFGIHHYKILFMYKKDFAFQVNY